MRARLPLQRKVLPELLRFPAFFALSAGAAVFAALGKDKFCHACIWAALLSCTAQLAAEAYGRCGAKARRLMLCACPVLAALCLLAGIPPVGIVDVPLRSQTKIMERILDSHGLIRDGAVDSARAAQELSPEEKKDIDRAFGKLAYFAVYPAWCKGGYAAIFSAAAMQKYRCDVSVPQDTAVDIARYEQLYPVQADGTLLLFAGASFDAEQEIRARLRPESQAEESGEPIVIRTEDGFTLVLTYVSATLSVSSEKELKDKPFSRAVTIRGFACR